MKPLNEALSMRCKMLAAIPSETQSAKSRPEDAAEERPSKDGQGNADRNGEAATKKTAWHSSPAVVDRPGISAPVLEQG